MGRVGCVDPYYLGELSSSSRDAGAGRKSPMGHATAVKDELGGRRKGKDGEPPICYAPGALLVWLHPDYWDSTQVLVVILVTFCRR